jgi:hypothetical protein
MKEIEIERRKTREKSITNKEKEIIIFTNSSSSFCILCFVIYKASRIIIYT